MNRDTFELSPRDRERLTVCWRLRPFMPMSLRAEDAGQRSILTLVLALSYRSSTTYDALLMLCEAGYGAQALMLSRSLFEDMVDIHWAHGRPEEALERYREHALFSNVRQLERLQKYGDGQSWAQLEEYVASTDPEERARVKKLYGRGAQSWTRLNLYARVEAIAPSWTTAEDQRELRMCRDVGLGLSNDTLHPSAATIARQIRPLPDAVGLAAGPSGEFVAQALFLAFYSFSQVLGLIYQEFGLPDDDVANAYMEGRRVFWEPSREQRCTTPGSALCPCGSGRAFKDCHGL